jgi:hypothetical protein
MRIIFVNGREIQLTFRELLGVHRHPYTVGLILFGFLAFQVIVPVPKIDGIGPVLKTFFWVKLMAVLYGSYFGLAWVFRDRTFVSPLTLGFSSIVMTASSSVFLYATLGVALTPGRLIMLWLVVWAITCMSELFFVTYLARFVPTVQALHPERVVPVPIPVRANPEPSGRAGQRDLMISGERFDPSKILFVTSEEHYLRIVSTDRTRHLRGRIADVEAQMPASVGFRVHRSHWVARQAVRSTERDEAGVRLILSCGARIPVARGRQAAVRRWLHEAEAVA